MPYFNIDEAVKHVKTIADNNRCPSCDKLCGVRLRYSCGHIICGECVEETNECLICIDSSKSCVPQIDKIKEQQVQNASLLIATFQAAFKVDVYKRYRLSEKLKIEEQVFPKLIPVSLTYINKRRSSQRSTKENKENFLYLDGERISNLNSTTMNTRVNLVQKWLDANEKIVTAERKPFSDINLNRSLRRTRDSKILNILGSNTLNNKKTANKKSKNAKLKVSNSKGEKPAKQVLSQCLLKSYVEIGVNDENKAENTKLHMKTLTSCNEGESGNSNNELNTIVIQNTLSPAVDKDKQAWLAVLQADNSKDQDNNSTIIRSDTCGSYNKSGKNVCFYKKYFLFKSCHFCLTNLNNYNVENTRLTCNDVSITIKTNGIVSSSLIKNDEFYDKMLSKHSIEVQTEENYFNEDNNLYSTFVPSIKKKKYSSSEKNVNPNIEKDKVVNNSRDSNKTSNLQRLVINDSDSDTDINCGGQFKVIADVHRSSDVDYGVLSSVDSSNYKSRLRQSRLRRTIDSNNSSEKENVEPNKAKKLRLNKKNELKK